MITRQSVITPKIDNTFKTCKCLYLDDRGMIQLISDQLFQGDLLSDQPSYLTRYKPLSSPVGYPFRLVPVLILGIDNHPPTHPLVDPETLYYRDDALLYIAYVMFVWAAPIPADRWHCSLWP